MQLAGAAEERFSAEEVKSAFLLNFGRFVEWPSHSFQKAPDRFNICIIGEDPLGDKLDAIIRDQKVKERTLEIKRLSVYSATSECQIAYLNLRDDKQISRVLSVIKATPTLTVGDDPRFLKAGGMIQLQIEGERLHLRISLKAAQGAGLTISSKLLAIAEVVE